MRSPGQSYFVVTVRAASSVQRRVVEDRTGGTLGSDACVIVKVGEELVGWGDDYGTFHPLTDPVLASAGEDLLSAALAVWESVQ